MVAHEPLAVLVLQRHLPGLLFPVRYLMRLNCCSLAR